MFASPICEILVLAYTACLLVLSVRFLFAINCQAIVMPTVQKCMQFSTQITPGRMYVVNWKNACECIQLDEKHEIKQNFE